MAQNRDIVEDQGAVSRSQPGGAPTSKDRTIDASLTINVEMY